MTHVDGSVDPVRDKEIIDVELQLKDLETIEARIDKLKKAVTVAIRRPRWRLMPIRKYERLY